MALEGIATLPQAPGNAPQTVSTRDALDASKQALAQTSPEGLQQYDQVMNDLVNQIDITGEEIDMMLQLLDYLLQNEANYPEIRAHLIATNQVDEEDLPEEFDRGFLITLINVLHEKQDRMGPTTQPQGFAKGGLAAAAESLRRKGRGGDTILAHINPQEAALLRSRGGKGTINPKTGLPEFGFFSKVWKAVTAPVKAVAKSTVGRIVLTVALGAMLGPGALGFQGLGLSAGLAGGLAAGATTLAAGGNLKDALISGALGGITIGLTPALSSYMPGAAGSFLNTALSAGAIGAAGGMLRGQSLSQALKSGALAGVTAGGIGALSNQMTPSGTTEGTTATTVDQPQGLDSLPSSVKTPSDAFSGTNATDIANQGGALTGNVSQEASPFGIKAGPSQGIQSLNQLSAPTLPNAASPAAPTGPASFMTRAGQFYNNPSLSSFGEMIMPSDATPAQLQNSDAFKAARASGATYTEAMNAAKSSVNPGMMAKYGPTVALGLGATALAGGFKAKPATPPGLTNPNITGETLIKQDPNKYIVQGMPGVRYNQQGGIDYTGTGQVFQGNQPSSQTVNTQAYGLRNSPAPMYQPPATAATQQPGGVQQPYNTANMYDFMYYNPYAPQRRYADGGMVPGMMPVSPFAPPSSPVEMYSQGGPSNFPRKTGHISGPGTGTSDSIPAMLSDGEFVITAKAVKGIGNGSRRAGAKKLYRMMHAMEKKAGGSV